MDELTKVQRECTDLETEIQSLKEGLERVGMLDGVVDGATELKRLQDSL